VATAHAECTAGEHAALVARAMADPATYPDPPERVEVVETHASLVFLAGARAYKVKKPVVLSFLDHGTLARRRTLCREEVRLNRRLAPRVYLRTVVLVQRDAGFALVPDDPEAAGDAIEVAVEMRRFAEDDTLAARVRAGTATGRDAERIGHLLAGFHQIARRSRDHHGATQALRAAMQATLDDLAVAPAELVDLARVAALRRFLMAFMRAREPQLAQRGSRGLVCDDHGDPRAKHIVLGDTPQIVDCVEFDPALRVADVAVDLSFLVMDLEALEAPWLARRIVEGYRRSDGDPGDDRLLAGLACFRALVRAKVAAVRAGQGDGGGARADVRRLVDLAERLAWRARGPMVLVCCGPAASGKSTLAAALSRRASVPHLASDPVRKSLVGLAPTARAPLAAYEPDVTAATYVALAERTGSAVAAHGGAIVDATFHTAASREAFLGGLGGCGVPVLFIECRAPATVLERRAVDRARDPERVSDATVAVVRRQVAAWEPFGGVPVRQHLVVRADQPVAAIADEVLAWLDRRLEDETHRARRTR
jgi:aminoglycoside phosphotransferase family enzyme/predicted kinase